MSFEFTRVLRKGAMGIGNRMSADRDPGTISIRQPVRPALFIQPNVAVLRARGEHRTNDSLPGGRGLVSSTTGARTQVSDEEGVLKVCPRWPTRFVLNLHGARSLSGCERSRGVALALPRQE